MKKSEMIMIQSALKENGKYTAEVDGLRGTQTDAAIHAYLLEMSAKLDSPEWPAWSANRKAVAALQLLCLESQLEVGAIDGLYGPQTDAASELLRQLKKEGVIQRDFVDIVPLRKNPFHFPLENSQNLQDYYGQPGEVPLVKIPCPWQLRLDWDLATTTRIMSIHEKLGESLARVLARVYDHYGEEGIKKHGLDRYGGSYNCRKKRGSTTSWSTHAWGIAIDWFPSRNQLKWRSSKASLAQPELDYWWEAWENEGWLSLGRVEDRDWMHVQAAKR